MTFGAHIPELQLELDQARAGMRAGGLAEGETYVELGSGEGKNMIIAADEFKAEAHGIEILPYAIDESHERAAEAGVKLHIEQGDLMEYDPSHADVLLMHLGPAFHDVLAPWLEERLRPETRVVACGWRVPGWMAIDVDDSIEFHGHIYRPCDPAMHGEWIEPPTTVSAPGGSRIMFEIVFVAHADLNDLAARCDDETIEFGELPSQLARGQGASVEVYAPVPPTGSETTLAISVDAADRQGQSSVKRGPAVSVTVRGA